MWDNGGGNSGTRDMVRVKTGGEGADLAGLWQVEHDGYNEVWNVQTKMGQFAVEGALFQKGRKVGYWVGVDPKFADGKLVCTQKWVVKPEPGMERRQHHDGPTRWREARLHLG